MSFRWSKMRSQGRWRRIFLAGAPLATILVGCSMPGSDRSAASDLKEAISPVRTASYQEFPIDEDPVGEIEHPLQLNLKFARWMEECENYPEAQQHYKIVLQERPEDLTALLGMARIDQASRRIQAAEDGFRKAYDLHPQSPLAQDGLGGFYLSQNRLSEALPLLQQASTADPANKAFRFHLAVALARSGKTAESLPHFKRSVGDVAAHYNLGQILQSQGQRNRAEEQFRQALALDPDLAAAQRALAELQQPDADPQIYAGHERAPQVPQQARPASHQRPAALTPAQREQLSNQRPVGGRR